MFANWERGDGGAGERRGSDSQIQFPLSKLAASINPSSSHRRGASTGVEGKIKRNDDIWRRTGVSVDT